MLQFKEEESDQNVNASEKDTTPNEECPETETDVTESVDEIEVANAHAVDIAKNESSNSSVDDRLLICSKFCPENLKESEKEEDASKMQVDVVKTEVEITITEEANIDLKEKNENKSVEDRMEEKDENLPITEAFSCAEKATDHTEATCESQAGHEPEHLSNKLEN